MKTDALKRRIAYAALLTTCALMLGVSSNAQRAPQTQAAPAFVDGDVIVRFRPGVAAASRTGALLRVGGALRRHLERLDIDHVRLPQGVSVQAAIALLSADPNVLSAEPNYIRTIVGQAPPNDPYWLDGSLWGLERIGAKSAWDRYGGGNDTIVVAIIDTGINWTHPDLAAKVWTNPGEIAGNGIDDDGNGYIDDVHGMNAITNAGDPADDNGHGTHVAGTIGAVSNNGIGVAGVAPNVELLACKFIGSDGNGTDIDAIQCLDYLVDLKVNRGINVRVTNNSWGATSASSSLRLAFDRAANADILNVAAAGNSGANNDTTAFYPASYTSANILAVTASASDANDSPASFSNYGQASVDLAAPGVGIFSTIAGGYNSLSGTSMASPHVAGAAALLLAHDTSRSSAFVKNAIMQSVDLRSAWTTRTVSGGRLNINRMLSMAGVNADPAVTITSPANNAVFGSGSAITIVAAPSDADGSISRVDFFRDGVPFGTATTAPYTATFANAPLGSYTFSAVATDNAGAVSSPASVFVLVVDSSFLTLWPAMPTPDTPSSGDTQSVELGVKFRVDQPGEILGVRYYKGPSNTGSHVGSVWSPAGTRMASATFVNETATGWQEVRFATPVVVLANTTYVASYHANNGGYATNANYFATSSVDNGQLHAPSSPAINGNGVYAYGPSVMPTSSYQASNYWVDVLYRPAGASDTTPPSISGVQATALTSSSATIQWTTNEAADSQVAYGLTTNYSSQSALDATRVTTHSVVLNGLAADTLYHYRVDSRDASGNLAQFTDLTFRTAVASSSSPAQSLWASTATPQEASAPGTAALEVGVKFRSDVAGEIIGVRFYKGAANTGTHIGNLWSVTGTRLATATFTNETTTGWQEVLFSAPVAIAANTTYVASYHMDNGGYARTFNYFATSGADNGVLHAPATGVVNGNGVYAYGVSAFPSSTYSATNYWVDVLFRTAGGGSDTTPPLITSVQATGATTSGATIQWTTDEPSDSQVSYGLTSSYGVQSALDPTRVTAHGVVLSGLAADTLYHYRVDSRDASGNLAQSADFTFRTAAASSPAPTVSLWPATATPAESSAAGSAALEVGMKFRSDVAGQVTGVRFYKGPGNTGVHVGHLWSAMGTLLGTATFTNETQTGWQEVSFAAPVTVTANTIYVVSYHMDNGGYARDFGYFASAGVDNGPLHAPASPAANGNGVYVYGLSAFPSSTYQATNYWVDVVFKP